MAFLSIAHGRETHGDQRHTHLCFLNTPDYRLSPNLVRQFRWTLSLPKLGAAGFPVAGGFMRWVAFLSFLVLSCAFGARAETPANEVRSVITAFEDGMADRNVAHLQKVVAGDVVSIRNGIRSDGWEDFRDHRLIPEFAQAAPASRWEIVKLNASADLAWAYAKTRVATKGRTETFLWTVFVLERRGKEWKIVLIDQNPGRAAPTSTKTRAR